MKLARLGVLLCAVAAACAEAGGDVKGGQLTDAGEQAATPGDFDGGVIAGPCGDGDTWSSLYRDLFGPTGNPGSCSFKSYCHGTPDGDGAKSGAGIQCFDEKTCRESTIAKGLWSADNAAKPEKANGLSIIRNINPVTGKVRGIMPKEPSGFVFSDACIKRIEAWIAKGVPAD